MLTNGGPHSSFDGLRLYHNGGLQKVGCYSKRAFLKSSEIQLHGFVSFFLATDAQIFFVNLNGKNFKVS